MSEEKRLPGNGRTEMDFEGQAESNELGWWQRKRKALWEKSCWQRIVIVPIWLQKMTQVKPQQKNLDVVNGEDFDIRLLLCH